MIRCRLFLVVAGLLGASLAGAFLWAAGATAGYAQQQLPAQRQVVSRLQLTDLALWSEARYTRHPAMSDLFSPFQDHPGASEHFPAGAVLAPVVVRPLTTLVIRRRAEGAR